MKAWQCILILSAHSEQPPGPVKTRSSRALEYLTGFVLWKLTQNSAVHGLYQMAHEAHVEMKAMLSGSPLSSHITLCGLWWWLTDLNIQQ